MGPWKPTLTSKKADVRVGHPGGKIPSSIGSWNPTPNVERADVRDGPPMLYRKSSYWTAVNVAIGELTVPPEVLG
jgi:hypothetical protein